MRVELKHVGKRFGSTEALRDLSLSFEPGARVGLIGPNGSGKSTLLRIVMGLLSCDGDVLLDGRSPFDHRVEIASRLAYVPQVAPQLGASVGEMVRAVESLRSLTRRSIETMAMRFDLRLTDIWRRPFRNLSGGMKQKLLIAFAFASNASLLILDEPTASLDLHSRETFTKLLDDLGPNTTVILCSHRLDEVRRQVERIVGIAEGRIAYDGAASEVRDEHMLDASPTAREVAS